MSNYFIKYCIVGLIGTFLDLSILYILVDIFNIGVFYSVSISFIISATNNFLLNNIWTFSDKDNYFEYQSGYYKYIKFMFISVIGLLLTLFFMFIYHHIFMIWYLMSKILTSIMVLLWNYYANKYWTFKKG